MFCDACGTALHSEQAFCGKCGKEVRAGFSVAYPRPSRVKEHVRLLGILWLAYSALHLFGGVALRIVANVIFAPNGHFAGPPQGPAFMHSMLGAISTVLLLKAVVGVIAGWGLLQRESWGRVLALIVAFVSLINVPLGTALGIYTLWVLLPADSEKDYLQQTAEWHATA
jgi:ABC-type glycerol-3-phosphate transport system permease component